jgi:hypothetical protein
MSTSDATAAYPYPILSRLHEVGAKPNRQRILRTEEELTANAASVDSVYGDHGHAFLTMSPANYQTLNDGVAFNPPEQPDPNPVIPAGATAAAIAEAVRQHGVAQKAYALMRLVQATLRKMLLDSSDEIYWRRMRQPVILYSARTVLELLTHISTTYGNFTEAERKDVTSRMDVPWEGGPLETVIQQIQEASDAFGLGGAALSDTQKRDKLYDLVSASNLLSEACQRWRMRPEPEKTWDAACTHFQQYANDRDEVQTAGGAGFHANHVETALAANAEALTNLNQQVANLGISSTNQTATILELTTKLASAEAAHQAYRDTVTGQRTRNPSGHSGRGGDNEQRRPAPAPTRGGRVFSYCWSHGYCGHPGPDCRSPREGHQPTATLENRMSGSNLRCGG